MASTVRLTMTFLSTEGKNMSISYRYADSSVSSAAVNTLMSTMIENGSIFKTKPASKRSAKLTTTSEESLDIT